MISEPHGNGFNNSDVNKALQQQLFKKVMRAFQDNETRD